MQEILIYLFISLVSFDMFNYARNETRKEKVDTMTKLWYHFLDFRILAMAIFCAIIAILSFLRHFFNIL